MRAGARRAATFLFTDVEGSTAAWEADPVAMEPAMRAHDRAIERAVAAANGEVVKNTGDGVFAVFDTSAEAVGAAAAIQRSVDALPFNIRIGLHVGEAEARDGDYFGPDVNRAARVMAIANGGQVLVTDSVIDRLAAERADGGGTAAEIEFENLGSHRLKDLYRPQVVYQVCAPGLHRDFPPPASLNATIGNLPPGVPLIGRDQDLAELVGALSDDSLIVLIGPGGMGKTSLAIAAATAAEHQTPDGTWFVDLSTADATSVVPTVASAVGIAGIPADGLEAALLDFLATRDLRLVIDNCEQVVDEAARLIDQIRLRAPQVRILATSRIRIGVTGVRSIAVRPLTTGSNDGAAVELFIARARQARPGIELNDQLDAIREICAALDGLPLAIELAARRVTVLSPTDLLKRLDRRFALLRSREADSRALLATLEWSFDLLDAADRDLFERLGVFRAPFDLAGATAVAADDIDEFELLEGLTRLVDSSLLFAEDVGGITLYKRLVSVREFAALKFDERADIEAIRSAHASAISEYATFANQRLLSERCLDAVAVIAARFADVRSALEHHVAHSPAEVGRIIEHLRLGLSHHVSPRQTVDWIDAALGALESDGDNEASLQLLGLGADAAWSDGDHATARDWAESALAMADRLGVEPDGLALLRLATIHVFSGDSPAAVELCDLVVAQADADPSLESYTLGAAGALISISGDAERGAAIAERAVQASRPFGPLRRLTALVNLNLAAYNTAVDQRIERAEATLAQARAVRSRFHESHAAKVLAHALSETHDPRAPAAALEAAAVGRDCGQWASVVELIELFIGATRRQAPEVAAQLLAGTAIHRAELAIPATPEQVERWARYHDELAEVLGDSFETHQRRGRGQSINELFDVASLAYEELDLASR